MLLEYLFYGEAIRVHLLYHNNSIYQKLLREKEGDFKGKEFSLDYLARRFLTDVSNLGGRTLDKFQLKLLFDLEFEG